MFALLFAASCVFVPVMSFGTAPITDSGAGKSTQILLRTIQTLDTFFDLENSLSSQINTGFALKLFSVPSVNDNTPSMMSAFFSSSRLLRGALFAQFITVPFLVTVDVHFQNGDSMGYGRNLTSISGQSFYCDSKASNVTTTNPSKHDCPLALPSSNDNASTNGACVPCFHFDSHSGVPNTSAFIGKFKMPPNSNTANTNQPTCTGPILLNPSNASSASLTFTSSIYNTTTTTTNNLPVVGVFQVVLLLSHIEDFLIDAFGGGDGNDSPQVTVFVSDLNSGVLLASSVRGSKVVSNAQLGLAKESSNALIRDISLFLDSLENGSCETQVCSHKDHTIMTATYTNAKYLPVKHWLLVVSLRINVSPHTNSITQGSTTYTVVCVLAGLSLICSLMLLVWVLWYRQLKIWKIAQPTGLIVVLISNMMSQSCVFVLVGTNHDSLCVWRLWMVCISITFSCAALLAKVLRVYVVSTSKAAVALANQSLQDKIATRANTPIPSRRHSTTSSVDKLMHYRSGNSAQDIPTVREVAAAMAVLKKTGMSMLVLRMFRSQYAVTGVVAVVVFVQGAILAIWTALDPPRIHDQTRSCASKHGWGFFISGAVIVLLFVWGLYLSFLTRHFSEMFAESRTLRMTFYHAAVILVVVVIVVASPLVSNGRSVLLLVICGELWFSFSSQMALFIPRVYRQITIGDVTSEELRDMVRKHEVAKRQEKWRMSPDMGFGLKSMTMFSPNKSGLQLAPLVVYPRMHSNPSTTTPKPDSTPTTNHHYNNNNNNNNNNSSSSNNNNNDTNAQSSLSLTPVEPVRKHMHRTETASEAESVDHVRLSTSLICAAAIMDATYVDLNAEIPKNKVSSMIDNSMDYVI